MKKEQLWVDLSIANLCIVAILGVILRTKILFTAPWLNYLDLLDAHFHFAFAGWIGLSLLILLTRQLLPRFLYSRASYGRMLTFLTASSYGGLLSALFFSDGFAPTFFLLVLIVTTYFYGWIFIRHLRQTDVDRTTRLLAIGSIACLLLSAIGPLSLLGLRMVHSSAAILYRDSSYLYLHFQYNGFFSLAVLSLVFNKLRGTIPARLQQQFHQFALLLCLSIIPSLFLSFLWQNPNDLFRLFAVVGSILILISAGWFIYFSFSAIKYPLHVQPLIRYVASFAMAAFVVKMVLQSLTIFPAVGNAIFGNRPVIIGYLHLVLLAFVSASILSFYIQRKFLDGQLKSTVWAILIFMTAVIVNEIALMLQGLGAMLLKSSTLMPWLLWAISLWLLTGTILIGAARLKSRAGVTLSAAHEAR